MQPVSPSPAAALELGIFAKTFRRSSVEHVFDAVAAYGLTCAQWNWACVPGSASLPESVPAQTTRAVARAAARSGVRICAVSATFNMIQPAAREGGLARLPGLAQAALALDCNVLTLCTGTRHPTDMWAYHPDNDSPGAWGDMMEGLRRASRIARRHGVRLAIEPETANVICDAAAAERALEELGPDAQPFSIVLDAANLYRPPMDPRTHPGIMDDAVERLGEHIVLAHAKDIVDPAAPKRSGATHGGGEQYTHVAAGTGVLPYAHYLAALSRAPAASAAAKAGQRLPLVLHGLDEEQVPASVAFLRESMRALKAA